MRNVGIIMRRELASYFATPLAYVFILIFLVLANAFTFYLGGFYERRQADLTEGRPVTGRQPLNDELSQVRHLDRRIRCQVK